MNTLKIPDAGVRMDGPGANDSAYPTQAFPILLNDAVIEGMVKCVRNGGKIELNLGSNPTFNFGSTSHRIETPQDSFPYDIYLTQPFESTRRAIKIPHSASLLSKPKKSFRPDKSQYGTTEKPDGLKPKPSASSKSSTSSSLDSDIEALQNGFAAHDAARERAHVVEGLPPSKKAAAKARGKLLPGGLPPRPRSDSTSPALHPVVSPSSTPVISASQQAMERAKEQRFTLVHELAVKDQPKERLEKKWRGTNEDLDRTLSKVAEYNEDAKTWSMRKPHWRELDVWKYDYDTQSERQKAIDNAIRQYDKQRFSSSEPEWQKLLPAEERGQGKCLSRLQANLARGPAQPAPKIKVQKTDDSSTSRDDGDSMDGDNRTPRSEIMVRSGSSNSMSKVRKPAPPQAQTKRLLGKAKAKAKPTTPKPTTPKPSPTKVRATGTKANGGRVLSQAIIENSDSSGDEALALKPKPEPKEPVKARDTVVVDPRPPATEPVRPKPQTGKRRREEEEDLDDSSSSSGTPLARRLPQKPVRVAKPLNGRHSDVSKPSRPSTTSNSTKPKPKNTSPTKSSPLASSPPTNASDMEIDSVVVGTKRKAAMEERSSVKRQAVRHVSTDVMKQAQKFKTYYQKYETLHNEVARLANPPDSKVADLLDMRDRLAGMKRDIYKQHASGRD